MEKKILQKRGTAIGARMAFSYANIFMDRLERRLIQNAQVKPRIWWRYIDDISEFKKLRRQLQRKRHIKIELCVK